MITITNVKKTFNKHHKNQIKAVDNTSLSLGDNGLVALLGPSGSGKTTLLNMIGGLDKPDHGKIIINGKKITHVSSYRKDKIRNLSIGYIFQDYKLIDNLSVYNNVALVLKMQGLKDKQEINKRVTYVLETLGLYQFRNRPAEMLSGGQRQRVGIARAIVKNPDIIIADEPTGNLDSKNSLEIMNIIKCISKTRLVILVTHEVELAKFFASRIIKIEDGKVIEDYENNNNDKLNYIVDSNIYLKDLKNNEILENNLAKINLYSEEDKKYNFTLVIRNNNIFIKSDDDFKIEVVDQNSNIELINDHYKEIDKDETLKYEFKNIDNNYQKKYSSILNPITLITNGFRKIGNYSFLKKLLLFGFMISSMFIVFGVSRIFASLEVQDKNFITTNKTYIEVKKGKLNLEDYDLIAKEEDINYLIPKDSTINFNLYYDEYMQSSGITDNISASLASLSLISKKDLTAGKMPENDYEVVVSEMTLKNIFSALGPQQVGILNYKDMVGKHLKLNNMDDFVISGITAIESPSIYANDKMFINMLSNTALPNGTNTVSYLDYTLKANTYTLKNGSWPVNDYEVVINYNDKDTYPLNKMLDNKINGNKLKVVGYYQTATNDNYYLVNNKMILSTLLKDTLMVSSNDKDKEVLKLNKLGYNASDTYQTSKKEYLKAKQESTNNIIVLSSIMIGISLIEIFLMIRSSFLSRIKEIGTYRAIGVKKSDIYKMFLGEILAITFTASLLGVILMSYILSNLLKVSYFDGLFMLNNKIILLSFILCLGFNVFVGLIPVANVIRKTPAAILARHDI